MKAIFRDLNDYSLAKPITMDMLNRLRDSLQFIVSQKEYEQICADLIDALKIAMLRENTLMDEIFYLRKSRADANANTGTPDKDDETYVWG